MQAKSRVAFLILRETVGSFEYVRDPLSRLENGRWVAAWTKLSSMAKHFPTQEMANRWEAVYRADGQAVRVLLAKQ
jgi:hypothetical protein